MHMFVQHCNCNSHVSELCTFMYARAEELDKLVKFLFTHARLLSKGVKVCVCMLECKVGEQS